MNKKTMTIAAGVATGIFALSACGTETYGYEVSGTVQEQYVDYEGCPESILSMDTVSFVAGGGKGGSRSSTKNDTKDVNSAEVQDAPPPAKKPTATSKTSTSPRSGTSRSASPAPSATPTTVKNKGVELKKKPEKPERLKGKKAPKPKYKFKPHKDCDTEYEIFVLADDGTLYEQDVRKADYDKCLTAKVSAAAKGKLFPLCTKG